MSLFDQIEKLQKKPRETRERALAVSVLILMILIIAVWASIARERFSSASVANFENPAKSLWLTASEGFKTIKEQFK